MGPLSNPSPSSDYPAYQPDVRDLHGRRLPFGVEPTPKVPHDNGPRKRTIPVRPTGVKKG